MKEDPPGRGPFWQSPLVLTGLSCALASLAADLLLAGRSSGDLSIFVGRFHPLIVHLPIGMLVLLATLEVASLVPGLRDRVDKATTLVLPLLVATAAASFVVGHLLAGGGGFPSRLVLWHRRLTLVGIVGASASLVAWAAYERLSSGGRRLAYRALVALTLGGLSAGAHYGGSITRGEGYLTKYAPEPVRRWLGPEPAQPSETKEAPREPGREAMIFEDVVLPVLRQRCVECHGAETVKASLRLDSLEAIQKGGENGPVIIVGAGDKSSLVTRMRLPVENDERMPPEGREGPSAEEIALIAWWIDRGATPSLRVRDALAPESTRAVLEKALSAEPAPSGSAPTPSATTAPSASPSAAPSAEPTAQGTASEPVASGSHAGLVYADRVAPVLAAKCEKCHGEAKQKGKLRVDSLEALLRGGKEGPALVAGSADRSALLSRARLPLSDPEHMPPPKEPQLTAKEIALIAFWIDHGATDKQSTSELPAELRGPTPPVATVTPTATTEPTAPPVPTTSSTPPSRPLPPEIDLFRDVAHPILVSRCAGCHGEEQDSGDLRVDVPEKLLAGGESGPAIIPGAPDKSLLLQRIHLPLEDTDHMPPEGQPQPTAAEIAALRHWIASGAKTVMPITTASLAPDVAAMLAEALPAEPLPQPIPSASASGTPSPSASASASPREPRVEPEPQGPPPVVSGGCAGCAATSAESRAAPLALAALGALFLWLRRSRRSS